MIMKLLRVIFFLMLVALCAPTVLAADDTGTNERPRIGLVLGGVIVLNWRQSA